MSIACVIIDSIMNQRRLERPKEAVDDSFSASDYSGSHSRTVAYWGDQIAVIYC